MNTSNFRSTGLRIVVITAAALFSTAALALSLTWEFGGHADDGTAFLAALTFDASQSPTGVLTDTIVIEPPGGGFITDTRVIETYSFDSLFFSLEDRLKGSSTAGSIVQTNLLGGFADDQYMVDVVGDISVPITDTLPIAITGTLTMEIAGDDFFHSLLTSTTPLQAALPGSFWLSYSGGTVHGTLTSLSALTSIPEPWTLGLMATGLGSLGFLGLAGIRSRRTRKD